MRHGPRIVFKLLSYDPRLYVRVFLNGTRVEKGEVQYAEVNLSGVERPSPHGSCTLEHGVLSYVLKPGDFFQSRGSEG